jgi:hypothetical protein
VLRNLVSEESGCPLQCVTVEARAAVPPGLFAGHAFGIVRRGVLIRQRDQPEGAPTALDVAGPGAYVPLASSPGGAGYAAARVLLCVYPEARVAAGPDQERLACDLLQLLAETLARVERLAEARGRPSAAERLVALLGALGEWLGPEAGKNLLQRDLAALLGMRNETVCRLLRADARPA